MCLCRGSKKNRKYNIDDLKQYAKNKKGKCLSEEYINAHTKLQWQCEYGHQWEACFSCIKSGSWCPYCAGKHINISDAQKLAKLKNGVCLSEEYMNSETKLVWQCEYGHKWMALYPSVKKGTWCPYCAGKYKTIQDMQKMAEEKNGKCLSEKYSDSYTSLKWECEQNHIWEAPPARICSGHWCPICGKQTVKIKNRKYDIDDLRQYVENKNGKCLSNNYINTNTKYEWECNICGHVWENIWNKVKYGKQWCPQCAGQIITLRDVQKLVESKDGKCLSTKYINNRIKMRWECKYGHIFEMSYGAIQQGQWCPKCAPNSPVYIGDMYKLAGEMGGKCLSSNYTNANTKLQWQCGKCDGVWEATPSNIQQGKWCPYCLYKKEQKFREVMEEYFDAEFPRKRPKWLLNENNNRIELDGYNEELGVAFEYQGGQHFNENHYFNKSGNFDKTKRHDKIKKEVCEKRGIILLCPTHELDEKDFENFIINEVGDLLL